MKRIAQLIFLGTLALVTVLLCQGQWQAQSNLNNLDDWTYIEVDNSREPYQDWVKYFGLAMGDLTGDGYGDIVSGRYFYPCDHGSKAPPVLQQYPAEGNPSADLLRFRAI